MIDEESLLFEDGPDGSSSTSAAPSNKRNYGSTLEGRRASSGASHHEPGARGRFRRESPVKEMTHSASSPDPPSSADDGGPPSSAGESGLTIRGRRPSHLPAVLDVHTMLAEQGGETAEEEEQRLLGHVGGGDGPDHSGGKEASWKLAVRVSPFVYVRVGFDESEGLGGRTSG